MAAPIFSAAESGSQVSSTLTFVAASPRSSNQTVPAFRGSSRLSHDTRWSGSCVVIRIVLPPDSTDAGREMDSGVVQLINRFHAAHEVRKFLELRPLVVGLAWRNIDFDGFLNCC